MKQLELYKDKSLDERCPISGMTYREVLEDVWDSMNMRFLCPKLPQTPEQRRQLAEDMDAVAARLEGKT